MVEFLKQARRKVLNSFTVGEVLDNDITLQSVAEKLEQIDDAVMSWLKLFMAVKVN